MIILVSSQRPRCRGKHDRGCEIHRKSWQDFALFGLTSLLVEVGPGTSSLCYSPARLATDHSSCKDNGRTSLVYTRMQNGTDCVIRAWGVCRISSNFGTQSFGRRLAVTTGSALFIYLPCTNALGESVLVSSLPIQSYVTMFSRLLLRMTGLQGVGLRILPKHSKAGLPRGSYLISGSIATEHSHCLPYSSPACMLAAEILEMYVRLDNSPQPCQDKVFCSSLPIHWRS